MCGYLFWRIFCSYCDDGQRRGQWLSPRQRPCGRDWTDVVCFSCGKLGHAATRCPNFDESFLFLQPGWQVEKTPVCITLHSWISSGEFPSWIEVKCLSPELRLLWHYRNNLSVDDIWRKRSTQSPLLQLLVPKPGREQLFLLYHASLFGGHLGRTLARLAHCFYWSGMSDDVKEWLRQCVKGKSPVGRHHPLGNIPTGHHWDCIPMNILDVCDPTLDSYRYILVIADYFSKWTEAFHIKNKCADTVADVLVENIILRFDMPLAIHSDQGREFENGLMKSL